MQRIDNSSASSEGFEYPLARVEVEMFRLRLKPTRLTPAKKLQLILACATGTVLAFSVAELAFLLAAK